LAGAEVFKENVGEDPHLLGVNHQVAGRHKVLHRPVLVDLDQWFSFLFRSNRAAVTRDVALLGVPHRLNGKGEILGRERSRPEDLKGIAALFASDVCALITGQTLAADW